MVLTFDLVTPEISLKWCFSSFDQLKAFEPSRGRPQLLKKLAWMKKHAMENGLNCVYEIK